MGEMLPPKAMGAMKAMKAMKAAKGATAMTATAAYKSVAESTGMKAKDVKGTMEALMGVAADQLKQNGSFKIAGALNLKLKKKPATPARKGINPFTKEPCVFKAKPASKTVKALPMKKTQNIGELMISWCAHCSESRLKLLGHGGRSHQA